MNPALLGAFLLASGAPAWLANLALQGVPIATTAHRSILALVASSSFGVSRTKDRGQN